MNNVWNGVKMIFYKIKEFMLNIVYLISAAIALIYILAWYIFYSITYRPSIKKKL